MQSFRDFLRCYHNKDSSQNWKIENLVEFYHNKGIDMLKHGNSLPNLANICLHSSTRGKFYPSTDSDQDLLSKVREDNLEERQ